MTHAQLIKILEFNIFFVLKRDLSVEVGGKFGSNSYFTFMSTILINLIGS